MSAITSKPSRVRITFVDVVTFIPVLLYPPLLFVNEISPLVRIGSFVLLTLYLLLAIKQFSKVNKTTFPIFLVFCISTLILNFEELTQLKTAGNMILTVIFGYALSRAVARNNGLKEKLVKLYLIFFTLVPIGALMSLIFFLIFGTSNIYHIQEYEGYLYLHTPFGVMLDRDIFGFHVYRCFSFFIEPVYLGLFCAVNVFLIAPNMTKGKSVFFVSNLIGGFLTFSFLFYVLGGVLYFVKRVAGPSSILFRFILMVGAAWGVLALEFFADSSLGVRFNVVQMFMDDMAQANFFQFMFGQGFPSSLETDSHHYNAGILTSIFEIGIVNVVGLSYLVFVLCKREMHIFICYLVASMVIEPLKFPIFWVLLVVLTVLLQKNNEKMLQK